jgi:hypothetical protein
MPISSELIEILRTIDTPTVCNALERIDPKLRITGFNRQPLVCPFPEMAPVVGFSRTAIIRCNGPNPAGGAARRRLDWVALALDLRNVDAERRRGRANSAPGFIIDRQSLRHPLGAGLLLDLAGQQYLAAGR